MKKLYVLYDHGCGLCCRAASWLRVEPKFLELDVLPAMSQRAGELFPWLGTSGTPPGEVVAVADTGEVYRGSAAWIMCLYALRRHRGTAITLAQPRYRPVVSTAIRLLSNYRHGLSHLLALPPERAHEAQRFAPDTPGCTGESCTPRSAQGVAS